MKANTIGIMVIKVLSSIVDFAVLTIVIILLVFAGYALWDSNQIYQAADKSQYTIYKPTKANQGKSFTELQAINADVFAWLTVYGTNIDYPVTQGKDNMKYVNTNADGLYSLTGSLFLDYRNSKDFTDFNSIIYGHNMDKKAMFGEIGSFSDKKVFDSHQYGNLYFDGEDHGIEIFAFIHTDAYNSAVLTPNIREEERQAYLDNLLAMAIHKRAVEISAQDHIVLLISCSPTSTNGRDILIGKITDETYQYLQSEEVKDRLAVNDENGAVIFINLQRMLLKLILGLMIVMRFFHSHLYRCIRNGGSYEK